MEILALDCLSENGANCEMALIRPCVEILEQVWIDHATETFADDGGMTMHGYTAAQFAALAPVNGLDMQWFVFSNISILDRMYENTWKTALSSVQIPFFNPSIQ